MAFFGGGGGGGGGLGGGGVSFFTEGVESGDYYSGIHHGPSLVQKRGALLYSNMLLSYTTNCLILGARIKVEMA